METRYLNYILTIAKYKNITKAAEKLYISQSSLSQYLNKLETQYGTPLFYRSKTGVSLTPAGELYVEAAHKILRISDQLFKDIQDLENRGYILIGSNFLFGLRAISELIPAYQKRYPDVTISINDAVIVPQIMENRLDLAILAAAYPEPYKGHSEILRREPLMLAVPADHPYCLKNPGNTITIPEFLSTFEQSDFVLFTSGSSIRELIDEVFNKYDFHPSSVCDTSNVSTMCNIVSGGSCVGFFSESSIGFFPTDKIHYYYFDPQIMRYNMLIYKSDRKPTQAEQAFADCIKDYFHRI